jgi:hypothetical protein
MALLVLQSLKREVPITVYDETIIECMQEFGLAACFWPRPDDYNSQIFVFEISFPAQLDENLLKANLSYFHDGHLMGRGTVCEFKKQSYFVTSLMSADPRTPFQQFQELFKLLEEVEIQRLELSCPSLTAKGVEVIRDYHNTVCLRHQSEPDWDGCVRNANQYEGKKKRT